MSRGLDVDVDVGVGVGVGADDQFAKCDNILYDPVLCHRSPTSQ